MDLFLIHWPLPTRYDGDYVSTWNTLEEFYRDGRARSIGVSNFQPHHIRRLHQECEIPPALDQIEVNPYLTQDDVRAFCAEHQIAVEAWSPLARGNALGDPTIDDIARRYGKTPAQVILRWHIERGDIVFPKSVTPARIRENIDIFDFELSGEDVEAITRTEPERADRARPRQVRGSPQLGRAPTVQVGDQLLDIRYLHSYSRSALLFPLTSSSRLVQDAPGSSSRRSR